MGLVGANDEVEAEVLEDFFDCLLGELHRSASRFIRDELNYLFLLFQINNSII